MSKKVSVLDMLKKDSFKKKEEPKKEVVSKEFEVVVIEKDFSNPIQSSFKYDDITDIDMRNDLINYEKLLNAVTSNYHSKVGEILYRANQKYANNKNGTFATWLSHINIGKKSAERLINRFKFIEENFNEKEDIEYFESLPLSLSYEVSAPSANKELITAVLDRKITTRKEFLAEKKAQKELLSKPIVKDFKAVKKAFTKFNNELSAVIEDNLQNNKIDNDKATNLYNKISALQQEIENILKNN